MECSPPQALDRALHTLHAAAEIPNTYLQGLSEGVCLVRPWVVAVCQHALEAEKALVDVNRFIPNDLFWNSAGCLAACVARVARTIGAPTQRTPPSPPLLFSHPHMAHTPTCPHHAPAKSTSVRHAVRSFTAPRLSRWVRVSTVHVRITWERLEWSLYTVERVFRLSSAPSKSVRTSSTA